LPFYYRIDAGQYHSLVVVSNVLVVHEVTNGPWTKDDTVWAEWSEPEGRN
jgi:mannose-6-phosphate isomerase-like protein (cupin superfamily)